MKPRRRWRAVALAAVVLVVGSVTLAGCDDDEGTDEPDVVETGATEDTTGMTETTEGIEAAPLELQLSEQNGSGVSGVVTLVPTSDGQVLVTIALAGDDGSAPRPAHIHDGTCAALGGVAYPLENAVDGSSETAIASDVPSLLAGPYAVNLHESEAAIDNYIACADIEDMG